MKVLLALSLIVCLESVHGYSIPIPGLNDQMQEYKTTAKSLLHKYKNAPKTVAQCEMELIPVLTTAFGSNCSYSQYFANISNTSAPNPVNYSDATAARDAMCTACNVAALQTTLQGTTYCVGNEETFVATRMFLDVLALECHKTGANYCFDTVFGNMGEDNNNDESSDTPPTQAELTTICTDTCFDPIATFIQTQAPCLVPFQFLTVVCTQDKAGTYCAEALLGMEQQYLNYTQDVITDTQEEAFHEALEPFCESCGPDLYTSWFTTKANEASTCGNGVMAAGPSSNFYGMICDVDATGDLCAPHIRMMNLSGGGRDFSDCPRNGPPSNYTTCGSATGCQAAQQSLASVFGCCYNSLIELFHGYNEVAAGKQWAEGTCGTKENPICLSLVEFEIAQGDGYQNKPAVLLSVLSAASVFMLML